MILEVRAAPPFMTNGFVLGCEATRQAVVIDPGDNAAALIDAVRAHGLDVTSILLTHAHLDHITGVAAAKAALRRAGRPASRTTGRSTTPSSQQGQMFGLRVTRQPPPDFALAHGDWIAVGGYEIQRAPHPRPFARRRVPAGGRRGERR